MTFTRKKGRPRLGEKRDKPWQNLGMSERTWYRRQKENRMTELEQAATDLFKAILKTGRSILGHTEFHFKIQATIATKTEDTEGGKLIGASIQNALDIARDAAKPVTIESNSHEAS